MKCPCPPFRKICTKCLWMDLDPVCGGFRSYPNECAAKCDGARVCLNLTIIYYRDPVRAVAAGAAVTDHLGNRYIHSSSLDL